MRAYDVCVRRAARPVRVGSLRMHCCAGCSSNTWYWSPPYGATQYGAVPFPIILSLHLIFVLTFQTHLVLVSFYDIPELPPTTATKPKKIENDRHNKKQYNAVSETNVIGGPVPRADGQHRACVWISIREFKARCAEKLFWTLLRKAEVLSCRRWRSTSFIFAAGGNGLAR